MRERRKNDKDRNGAAQGNPRRPAGRIFGYARFSYQTKNASSGRITFEVSGNKLDEELELYYQNPKVPINSFCASYKKIKSMIYNLKG